MSEQIFRRRLIIFIIVLAIGGSLLLIQYAAVMLGGPLPGSLGGQHVAVERGAITDRNGRLLALQTAVYTCSVWAPNLRDIESSAQLLAPLLGLDEAAIKEKLDSASGAIVLKAGLAKAEADPIRQLIDADRLPGIYLEEAVSRTYPEGAAAAHVIGFTGTDNQGMEGMEYVLDNELARQNQAMPDGRSYGNQITLTLDMGIQHAMEGLADRAVEEQRPEGLMILVMDAKSGEILAWTVRPGYDPNRFRKSSPEQRRNLPTQYTFEPGSVFKIFSLAAIMQLGGIDAQTVFHTSGGYRNKRFRDPITDLADYGTLTAEGIIKYSSNVGAAFASDTVSETQFHDMLLAFGFGQKTGIEDSGEQLGILKSPNNWSPRTKPTLAIGQEINVTAVQMLAAASALANDGMLLRPHLISRITAPNGEVVAEFGRQVQREILKPAVARQMLGFMNAATDDEGTGRRSRVQGIDLSVKTGTAQSFDREKGRYSDTDFIASSLALFPTQNPRIIMYVVIIKPRGESIYGGRIAAPLIKAGAEFIIPYLGIERDGDRSFLQGLQLTLSTPALPELKELVPDYRGLPLRTLLPLFQRDDIKVSIKGQGRVLSQDPLPGSPFQAGMTISLRLGEAQP